MTLILLFLMSFLSPGLEAENHIPNTISTEAMNTAYTMIPFVDYNLAAEGASAKIEYHGEIQVVSPETKLDSTDWRFASTITLQVDLHGGDSPVLLGPLYWKACYFTIPIPYDQVGHTVRYDLDCHIKVYSDVGDFSYAYTSGGVVLTDETTGQRQYFSSEVSASQPGPHIVYGVWGTSLIMTDTTTNIFTTYWGQVFREE